jgi:SAM-dependent methyltransferase
MTQQPWYESFFSRDYLDAYASVFTPERARVEVDFVIEALGLQPGQSVLDLCSGQGRHAVLLAAAGMQVTALDLAAEYLEMAQQAAREAKVSLETVHADMRAIPFTQRYDAVINMFSSFGYLESEAEDARDLTEIHGSLKPGGLVLLDLLNRDWVVRNYIQNEWHEGSDGSVYLEHREFDPVTSRNHVTFTAIAPDGSRRQMVGHHIRLYTLREVDVMLEAAGLAFEAVYGGFESEPFGIDSRRMIIVARRTG